MINISKLKDFYDGIRSENGSMIVRFCAEWSGPCHIMKPIFLGLSQQYGSLASFYEIDVDKFPQLQLEFGIIEIPTILFYQKGILVDSISGLISREALKEKLEYVLKG